MEVCADSPGFARRSTYDLSRAHVLMAVTDEGTVLSLHHQIGVWADTCPVLYVHRDAPHRALAAIAHGVAGVMPYDAAPRRMLRAAAALADGDAVVSPDVLAALAQGWLAQQDGTRLIGDQQREFLMDLARGHTVQQIAARHGWSERQMRRKLADMYRTLGVANRDQAVAVAGRLGLTEGSPGD